MHPSISNLTFGAEFEVVLPAGLNEREGARAVSAAAGLPVYFGRIYNDPAPAGSWKATTDGSIRGGIGLEFVSPILTGDDGLEQVRKICAALTSVGATVNATCGLHVHVGAQNEGVEFFKSLIKLYGRFESALDEIMPASRRSNGAQYCRSVTLVDQAAVNAARTKEELAFALARASGAGAAKYHKVNIVPHHKPTVEFRHHAGTTDAAKAINWIMVCLRLVAAAKAGKTGAGQMIAIDHANFALKTRAMLEMCGRPEGATILEICERFGFSVISVKRHARLAGIAYSKRGERYFITAQAPAPNSGAVPATLDGFAELIEATAEEREFLRARRAAATAR